MRAQDNPPQFSAARQDAHQFSATRLSDDDLLEVLLGERKAIGQSLLEKHGTLKALCREDFAILADRDELGPRLARRLLAAAELGRRLLMTGDPRPRLATPTDIYRYLAPRMSGLRREEFHVLCLSARNVLLRDACVAEGSSEACPVDPREVFSAALAARASAIVLAHNHPSGDPTPSQADIALTRQIVDGGQLLGVRVLDHLVVGDGSYSSFLEQGLLSDRPGHSRFAG